MKPWSCAVAALALTTAACPESTLKPQAPPETRAERSARILEAFSSWTVEDTSSAECAAYFAACVDHFHRVVTPTDTPALANPRAFMTNPDPAWIPGWDRLSADPSQASLTFAALTLAAATRAHWTACEKRYAETDVARTKSAALVDDEIRRLRGETNSYRKISGLVQLRTELLHEKRDTIGPRYTIELAIHEAFIASGRDLVYALQNQRSEDAGLLRPSLSYQEELELSCGEWLPAWQDPSGLPEGIVRAPVPEARLSQLKAKAEAARDLDERIPKTTAQAPPSLFAASVEPGALLTVDREVNGVPLSIKKVEEKDGMLVVELTGSALKKDVPFDCKEADKPSRVEQDGKLQYETQCSRRDESWKLTLKALLREPPDLELKPGDEMVVLGKLVTLERKEKRQGATTVVSANIEIEGSHILEVWRQKLLVADYFVQ